MTRCCAGNMPFCQRRAKTKHCACLATAASLTGWTKVPEHDDVNSEVKKNPTSYGPLLLMVAVSHETFVAANIHYHRAAHRS